MNTCSPVIGQWFERSNGTYFEVVAIDEDAATVEIQQYDGTIDEIDIDAWSKLTLAEVAAPEDWSGSVDMDPEDYVGKKDDGVPPGYYDPLSFLDKT
ncbi:MAG: hypothetical protein KJP16_08445 [Gammaproteobacteria bacterium]|nr:hypothetical protein [Gammaproteobacteria bacterium]NNC57097.1 hypothetical protein [Woeseiaceae bacterium]NNL50832.1 hypothetical protein [Woeseiaceae bacterium]